MIKTENGETIIKGTGAELLADYSTVGTAIKEAFESQDMPTERVKELLTDCVEQAFASEDELEKQIEEELYKLIKKLRKGDKDNG
jgi:hypothetical protein